MKIIRFALLGLCVGLVGCTPPQLGNLKNIGRESDPTRFYTLRAMAEKTAESQGKPQLTLGVGPVAMADYLDRSQIVVRESDTELSLAEFDRWAGSPAKELQRVLAANLATLVGTERVVTYPWKGSIDTDMTVEVTVERFEYAQGRVWLAAGWQVYRDNGREIIAFRRSELSREARADYAAISQGLSELVAALSQEMAQVVHRNAAR